MNDERLQIVFGVHDVAEGRVVDGEHDRRGLPQRLAGNRACVFERDGIALLRHDAAALHEAVGQPQVAELAACTRAAGPAPPGRGRRAAPPPPRRSRAGSRRSRCCRRCCRSAIEPEQRGRALAIDRKAGAGDRAGAERILIRAGIRRAEPRRVAFELLDNGQQIVGDRGRLRRLRVRVRGEDVV